LTVSQKVKNKRSPSPQPLPAREREKILKYNNNFPPPGDGKAMVGVINIK
jgi:hypothetical protein